jgi:hypothetical protein
VPLKTNAVIDELVGNTVFNDKRYEEFMYRVANNFVYLRPDNYYTLINKNSTTTEELQSSKYTPNIKALLGQER